MADETEVRQAAAGAGTEPAGVPEGTGQAAPKPVTGEPAGAGQEGKAEGGRQKAEKPEAESPKPETPTPKHYTEDDFSALRSKLDKQVADERKARQAMERQLREMQAATAQPEDKARLQALDLYDAMKQTEEAQHAAVAETGLPADDPRVNYAAPTWEAFMLSVREAQVEEATKRAKEAETRAKQVESSVPKLVETQVAEVLKKRGLLGADTGEAAGTGRSDWLTASRDEYLRQREKIRRSG